MPYVERLTWGGVALHAGGLPGYPESHGCIHLPSEFAQRHFEISPNGMTVVIGTEATEPERVAHPGYLAPVKFVGGQPVLNGILTPGATLFVTHESLYPETTGSMVQVVDADPPANSQPAHSRGSL